MCKTGDRSRAAAGYNSRVIAARLGIRERTVQYHVSNLYDKLGARSRTELVFLARQRRWLN